MFFFFSLDLDQSTFSPPEHDDTFLYFRYPQNNNNNNNTSDKVPPAVVVDGQKFTPITELIDRNKLHPDYRNHTKPCQQYLSGAPKTTNRTASKIVKSNGVDDGFKGKWNFDSIGTFIPCELNQ